MVSPSSTDGIFHTPRLRRAEDPFGAASGLIWVCPVSKNEDWQPPWPLDEVLYIVITWWSTGSSHLWTMTMPSKSSSVIARARPRHVQNNDPWNNARQKEALLLLLYGLVSIATCWRLNLRSAQSPIPAQNRVLILLKFESLWYN